MPAMNVILDGNNCWPDLSEKEVIHLGNGAPAIGVALLRGGMASGSPSVTIRIDLPDGKVVLAETSFALLGSAVDAMRARLSIPGGMRPIG